METNFHRNKKKVNKVKSGNSEQVIIDFGTRKICDQNFSKIICIPKDALVNCGSPTKVNVKLVEENGKKFIMLIPVPKTLQEEMEDKMQAGSSL